MPTVFTPVSFWVIPQISARNKIFFFISDRERVKLSKKIF